MLYVRAEPSASEKEREENPGERARAKKGGRERGGKSLRKIAAHSGTGRSLS